MTKSERARRADPHRHFLTHCAVMPGWHKAVILLAALLAVAGLAGTLYARSTADAHVKAASASGSESALSIGSVLRLSTPAMMIGASMLVGFIGGWFCRAYLLAAAGVAVLGIAGVFALSHFGILHLGATGAADAHAASGGKAASAGGGFSGFTQYAAQLKGVALAHLPSTSSAVVAAFLGFRRW